MGTYNIVRADTTMLAGGTLDDRCSSPVQLLSDCERGTLLPAASPHGSRPWFSRRVLASLLSLGLFGFTGCWLYYRLSWLPSQLLRQAFEAAAQDRLDVAEQAVTRYLSLRPGDSDGRILLAKLLIERKDNETALIHVRLVPRHNRWWPEARRMEGESLWQLGYISKAEAIWLECIRQHPESAWPRWDLMMAYFLEDRRTEGWKIAYGLYETGYQQVGTLTELLSYQVEPPSPLSESRLWESSLAVEPSNYYARRSLANCYIDLNRVQDAVALLEHCAVESPRDPLVWQLLVRAHLQQGDLDLAQAVMVNLPTEVSTDLEFLRYRGQILELGGQWRDAIAQYGQVVERVPWDRKLHYQLALLYRRLGDEERAQNHSEAAERLRETFNTLTHFLGYLREPGRPRDASLYREIATALESFGRRTQVALWNEQADLLENGSALIHPLARSMRRPLKQTDLATEMEPIY